MNNQQINDFAEDSDYVVEHEFIPDHHFRMEKPLIIRRAKLDPYSFQVYDFIMEIAQTSGEFWMSNKNIANELGISETKVKESIKNLVEGNNVLNLKLLKKTSRKKADGSQDTNVLKLINVWRFNGEYFRKMQGGGGSPENRGVGRQKTGGGSPNDHYNNTMSISNIEDNVLDNVLPIEEIQDPEMKKLSQQLHSNLQVIESQIELTEEIEGVEKTMTFSTEKRDIEKSVKGVKCKYPLKKEQIPVFDKMKSLNLECDDDLLIVLIRQNWAKGVSFLEDCLHHAQYVFKSGKAAIKSKIAFFRNCLNGKQALITSNALNNMRCALKYAGQKNWKEVKITEKYVQCLRSGKEVSTNISLEDFKRCVIDLFAFQQCHA